MNRLDMDLLILCSGTLCSGLCGTCWASVCLCMVCVCWPQPLWGTSPCSTACSLDRSSLLSTRWLCSPCSRRCTLTNSCISWCLESRCSMTRWPWWGGGEMCFVWWSSNEIKHFTHNTHFFLSGALQVVWVLLTSAIGDRAGCSAGGVQGGGCGPRRPVSGPLLWPGGSSHLAVHLQSPSDCPTFRLPLFLLILPDLRGAPPLWYHGVSAAEYQHPV